MLDLHILCAGLLSIFLLLGESDGCSLLATNRVIHDFDYVNHFLKFRGPDLTSRVQHNGYEFVHNLLHMTGEFTPQPFFYHDREDEDIAILFNGEIYNYKDIGRRNYLSDGQCIIDLYRKYGETFTDHLDGEWAIVIFDFIKGEIIIAGDIFGMRPIWYAVEPVTGQDGKFDIGISTFSSAVQRLGFASPMILPPNSMHILRLGGSYELLRTRTIHTFDLKQYKTTWDDWFVAFDNAVMKRTSNTPWEPFLGLSSGYDSGGIACALASLAIPHISYSLPGEESMEVMNARIAYGSIAGQQTSVFIDITPEQLAEAQEVLDTRTEMWEYKRKLKYVTKEGKTTLDYDLSNDGGAKGMSHIMKLGRLEGRKIFLSGTGADEIFSDYGFAGKKTGPSCFGGMWPKDLSRVWPDACDNFFDGVLRAYLFKEEHVASAYGVEGRYPYLDKRVVQEFLSTTAALKNEHFKAPLHAYMRKRGYPFEEGKKVGFKPTAAAKRRVGSEQGQGMNEGRFGVVDMLAYKDNPALLQEEERRDAALNAKLINKGVLAATRMNQFKLDKVRVQDAFGAQQTESPTSKPKKKKDQERRPGAGEARTVPAGGEGEGGASRAARRKKGKRGLPPPPPPPLLLPPPDLGGLYVPVAHRIGGAEMLGAPQRAAAPSAGARRRGSRAQQHPILEDPMYVAVANGVAQRAPAHLPRAPPQPRPAPPPEPRIEPQQHTGLADEPAPVALKPSVRPNPRPKYRKKAKADAYGPGAWGEVQRGKAPEVTQQRGPAPPPEPARPLQAPQPVEGAGRKPVSRHKLAALEHDRPDHSAMEKLSPGLRVVGAGEEEQLREVVTHQHKQHQDTYRSHYQFVTLVVGAIMATISLYVFVAKKRARNRSAVSSLH